MKSLTKVFVALLLAVTLALGGVQGNANAQTVGAKFDVAIDVNKTIDQILSLVTYSQKFAIQVVNQTTSNLTRVGVYNSLGSWPIGDVGSMRTVGSQFSDVAFSFASNYQIGNRYLQFGASSPPIGARRINVCAVNQSGNGPAQTCWNQMNSSDDKTIINGNLQANAIILREGDTFVWFYQVR